MCFLCCVGEIEESPLRHRQKDKRSCTDVLALLIFIIFIVGLVLITFMGIGRGNIDRVWYGADSFGNTCGRENPRLFSRKNPNLTFPLSGRNMKENKFLFPLDVRSPLDTVWLCVRECPKKMLISVSDIHNLQVKSNVSLCVSEHASQTPETSLAAAYGECPVLPVHKSMDILNRCIPEDVLSFGAKMANKILKYVRNMDVVRGYVMDVVKTSPEIAKMVGLSFVLSILSVFLLRFVAPVVVYFVYLMIVAVFAAISAGLWYGFFLLHAKATAAKGLDTTEIPLPTTTPLIEHATIVEDLGLEEWFRFDHTSNNVVLGLAIGSSVITLFVFVFVWCLIPRGKLLVDLFKKASLALGDMPILLLQPIVTAISVIAVAAYSLWVLMMLYTTGEPSFKHIDEPGSFTPEVVQNIVEWNITEPTKYLMFYQFVGLIWLVEFCMGCQRMLIAGAVSTWYFDRNRRNFSAVWSSFCKMVRYHLGSIAFGSFIITLVRVPRYVLIYIYTKMKATENIILQKLLFCFICTLGCIEKCLIYITSNAYSVIAYSGQSFIPACKTATNVMLDNAVNLATINSVGDFVIFLSKVTVATATSGITMFTLKNRTDISHWWMPVLVVFLCAYHVANCFLSVFEMAIDTLFLCCAEDMDMSKRIDQADYYNSEMQEYMSLTLRKERDLKSNRSPKKRRVYRDSTDRSKEETPLNEISISRED